jgi:hypothetical protein
VRSCLRHAIATIMIATIIPDTPIAIIMGGHTPITATDPLMGRIMDIPGHIMDIPAHITDTDMLGHITVITGDLMPDTDTGGNPSPTLRA